ncbi:MAG: hypothetical protein COV75_03085 [Candidatus Omnitrophica bacterium CG11_big_fil_rev_8_21_14_0_20_63_9]|nr:MAG: hypothetical protein COV75_03085 [Candidatus Omnitrophica bacterium CG11_big_fil_rev_8_21_14_0_20_63_9]
MNATELSIYGLSFGSAVIAGIASYPPVAKKIARYLRDKSAETADALSEMFIDLSRGKVWLLYLLAPIVVGAIAWLLTEQWLFAVVGLAIGIALPRVMIAQMERQRKQKFLGQLVDGLLLLSSSLKAGLSMMQAFQVLTEEMPAPISQEFGLVLKESKMGVDLSEAMGHLKKRMPSDDLTLFVTAVLVARETGGDITHIFGRLVETLRERKKIKERIKSLTFMARMQALIMGMLPFAFAYLVYQMDRNYFQFFITDPTGRIMLVSIIILQLIGGILFHRFSKSPL